MTTNQEKSTVKSDQDIKTVTKRDRILGLKCFTLNLFIIMFFTNMSATYLRSSLRMIEKHFGFSSEESGLIVGIEVVTSIIFLLIIGYLGDKVNKARILAICAVLIGISLLVHIIPYLISRNSEDDVMALHAGLSPNGTEPETRTDIVCRSHVNTTSCSNNTSNKIFEHSKNAYIVFIIARLLYGAGQASHMSICYTYINDNTDTSSAALHVGWITLTYLIGPMVGAFLASYTARMPLHLKVTDILPEDSRFIGAWWLGFLIMGAAILIFSWGLFCYPESLIDQKPTSSVQKEDENSKSEKCLSLVKNSLLSTWRLLKNPFFMVSVLSQIFIQFAIEMYATHTFRYLEFMFRIPIYRVNIIVGAGAAAVGIFGGLGGGVIVSCLRLKLVGINRFLLLCSVLGAVLIGISMLFNCPQLEFVGMTKSTTSEGMEISSPCSGSCNCDMSASQPVCGSDGLDYFTPCHAGCTNSNPAYQNVTGCSCITGNEATKGSCVDCNSQLIPYTVLIMLSGLFTTLLRVPNIFIVLKVVPKKLESYALSIDAMAYNLLANLPGPVLSGYLIDRSCLIWQNVCGTRGSCLLYDVISFRNITHVAGIVCGFLSSICFIIIGIMIHKNVINIMDKQREKEKQIELEDETQNVSTKL